jgi:hypothetical protein
VHERDRRFLLTLGKLALALATTGVVIALAVRWLPSLAQIAVVVPVGTALIFWALRGTPFDPSSSPSDDR